MPIWFHWFSSKPPWSSYSQFANFNLPPPLHRFSSKHRFSIVWELIWLPITFSNWITLIAHFFPSLFELALSNHFDFSVIFQFYQQLSMDFEQSLNLNTMHLHFGCPALAAFKGCSPVFEIGPFMSSRRPYSFCLYSSVVLVAWCYCLSSWPDIYHSPSASSIWIPSCICGLLLRRNPWCPKWNQYPSFLCWLSGRILWCHYSSFCRFAWFHLFFLRTHRYGASGAELEIVSMAVLVAWIVDFASPFGSTGTAEMRSHSQIIDFEVVSSHLQRLMC